MSLPLRAALALLAAILTRLALPGDFCLSFLAWIAVVPFFLTLSGARPLQRAMLGLTYGTLLWGLSIGWLPEAMVRWLSLPLTEGFVSTAALCFYHAMPYLMFGLISGAGNESAGGAGILLRDAALLTALLGLYPAIFPGTVALALYESPLLIQAAELGGIHLILFAVLLVNRCGAEMVRRLHLGMRPLVPAFLLLGTILLVSVYGTVRLQQMHAVQDMASHEDSATVAMVQPAIPITPKESNQSVALTAAMLLTENMLFTAPPTDVVVWPEVPLDLGCDEMSLERHGFVRHARTLNTPLLVNCIDYTAGDHDRQKRGAVQGEAAPAYNSAVLLNENGSVVARYHKQILFPFGEYVPFTRSINLLRRLAPATPAYRPGTEATVFDLGRGQRLAPLLCYEAVFPSIIRAALNKGGTVLINMADDAWFDHSAASELHLSFLPFRAVEFRMPLVRSDNAGISAFIAASGEILPGTKTGLFQQTVQRRQLFMAGRERTIYDRYGDLWLYGVILLYGLNCLGRHFRGGATGTMNRKPF